MMKETVLLIAAKDRQALAAIRCMAGLYAAEDEKGIWIKGIESAENPGIKIKQLPVKQSFLKDEQNLLFFAGGLTPVDTLKALDWQPLTAFIKVQVPVCAMPGQPLKSIPVHIIPSGHERRGDALITTLVLWKAYAETTPEARLAPLQFAASKSTQVLIMGNPLPSIPGKEYWLLEDMLLPCGYDFELPVLQNLISEKLNAGKDAFILFDVNGTWQKIPKTYFVPVCRSAVRLTKEAVIVG